MPEAVQAERAATGSCKVEEDEAIERCELAPVQDWKEALMGVRVEVGHRGHAGDDERGWPGEQTYHDEHAANQLDEAAAPLIVMGDALFIGPTGKFRYLVVPCCRRSSPDMMRSRLRSCAEYGRRKFMACLQPSRLRFV